MCGALALMVNGGRWRRGRRWHVEGDCEEEDGGEGGAGGIFLLFIIFVR